MRILQSTLLFIFCIHVAVGQNGDITSGKWVPFECNIGEDYRRLFGGDPPNPFGYFDNQR